MQQDDDFACAARVPVPELDVLIFALELRVAFVGHRRLRGDRHLHPERGGLACRLRRGGGRLRHGAAHRDHTGESERGEALQD